MIIFDLDGVIVDSEPLKEIAHFRTAEAHGGTLSADFYPRHLGNSQETVARAAIADAGLRTSTKEYNHSFGQIYQRLRADHMQPVPGSLATISTLVLTHHCRLGVVTSSPRSILDSTLEHFDITRFFATSVSSDDVKTDKPSPEPYVSALAKLGARTREAIAVEDTDPGIQSATDAGIAAIGYRHSLNRYHGFTLARAEVELISAEVILGVAHQLLV